MAARRAEPKKSASKSPPRRSSKDDGLDALAKKELVSRAESLGIDGASKFTKVELVDEIRRAQGTADRGLLGKARDLLKGVVDKGIARAVGASEPAPTKEPRPRSARTETASTRASLASEASEASNSPEPSPRATLTLAEIYLAQGHGDRAKAIVREVLDARPDDAAAKKLLERLGATSQTQTRTRTETRTETQTQTPHTKNGRKRVATEAVPATSAAATTDAIETPTTRTASPASAPVMASQAAPPVEVAVDGVDGTDGEAEGGVEVWTVDAIDPEAFVEPVAVRVEPPLPMLDDEPWPARYDVDECVAIAIDPTSLYVYWETRPSTAARARRALSAGGSASEGGVRSTLRILVVEPTDLAPRVTLRDFEVLDLESGEYFVHDLPPCAILRAAIGVSAGERFLPIAHTLDVEAPAAQPSDRVASDVVVWTEASTYRADALPRELAASLPSRLSAPPLLAALPSVAREDEDPGDDLLFGLGLSSAELAARRMRSPSRRGAESRSSAVGAAERLGASDRLARAPSSGSWAQRAR